MIVEIGDFDGEKKKKEKMRGKEERGRGEMCERIADFGVDDPTYECV